MLNQLIEEGVDLARVDEMIVIQYQYNVVRHIGQIIDEQGDQLIN